METDTLESHERNKNQISRKLTLSIEEAVSSDQAYILSVSGTQNEPEFKIGAALTDHSCVVYSVENGLNRITTLDNIRAPMGIKFSPTSTNILYATTEHGVIRMYDIRTSGKVVAEFKDTSLDVDGAKTLISFDISCDEGLIAGGTEYTGGDVFIMFWDIRKGISTITTKDSLLGGYWESHLDDITCLTFHPTKSSVMASGSTDGLINIYDLTKPSEELALTHTLNTKSSVDRLGWLTDDSLWCTTHTHALQFWDCEGASAYAEFTRDQFAASENDEPDTYVVRYHPTNTFGQPFALAGSSTAGGEKLRCLNVANNRLETLYEMVDNKQLVRDSWIHEKSGCLVTAGESGIVNVWRQPESVSADLQRTCYKLVDKVDIGLRSQRFKPY